MEITYTLVYRIRGDQVYNLYQEMSTNYQGSIVATVNVSLLGFLEYCFELFYWEVAGAVKGDPSVWDCKPNQCQLWLQNPHTQESNANRGFLAELDKFPLLVRPIRQRIHRDRRDLLSLLDNGRIDDEDEHASPDHAVLDRSPPQPDCNGFQLRL